MKVALSKILLKQLMEELFMHFILKELVGGMPQISLKYVARNMLFLHQLILLGLIQLILLKNI